MAYDNAESPDEAEEDEYTPDDADDPEDKYFGLDTSDKNSLSFNRDDRDFLLELARSEAKDNYLAYISRQPITQRYKESLSLAITELLSRDTVMANNSKLEFTAHSYRDPMLHIITDAQLTLTLTEADADADDLEVFNSYKFLAHVLRTYKNYVSRTWGKDRERNQMHQKTENVQLTGEIAQEIALAKAKKGLGLNLFGHK